MAAICCLGDEKPLEAAVLAELCVESLLVAPLLCQVADEQGHLQGNQSTLVRAFLAVTVRINPQVDCEKGGCVESSLAK